MPIVRFRSRNRIAWILGVAAKALAMLPAAAGRIVLASFGFHFANVAKRGGRGRHFWVTHERRRPLCENKIASHPKHLDAFFPSGSPKLFKKWARQNRFSVRKGGTTIPSIAAHRRRRAEPKARHLLLSNRRFRTPLLQAGVDGFHKVDDHRIQTAPWIREATRQRLVERDRAGFDQS